MSKSPHTDLRIASNEASLNVEELRKAIKRLNREKYEHLLEHQMKAAGLAPFVAQHVFHPTRKWRFDFAFLDIFLAVEVDGGLYIGGAHSRGASQEKDMEKRAEAATLGWTVISVSPGQVRRGQALTWIESIVRNRRRKGETAA